MSGRLQDRIAIVVLSNSSSPAPFLISEEIVATLMPDARRPAQPNQPPTEPVFKPTTELTGVWKGTVYTYKEEIPFTIEIKPDGDIHTRLGSQLRTLLNRVDFKDGYLTGQMLSDIGTEDGGGIFAQHDSRVVADDVPLLNPVCVLLEVKNEPGTNDPVRSSGA